MLMIRRTASMFLLLVSARVLAEDYSYQAISKRYPAARLDAATVRDAKMQGECLVGLKQLNFKRRDSFDPVAEWTSYRSLSLLEQFPPCQVLVMMEVARGHMIKLEPLE